MASKLIALIRHGAYQQKTDAPSALQPFPLTPDGEQEVRAQANAFAKVLRDNKWTVYHKVHSSPLLRAWQTAQLYMEELSEFFHQPSQHLEFSALTERSVGTVANLTIKEIEQIIHDDPRYQTPPKNWKSDSHYCLPFIGAESLLQAGERVAKHIETKTMLTSQMATDSQINKQNQVQLIVGHGAAIRHAACHLNVIKLCEVSALSMYHAHPVVVQKDENGWHHIAGQWKVRQSREEAKD